MINRFPSIYLELPSNWSYDAIETISIQSNVSIGLHADVMVLGSHPSSSVPGSLSTGADTSIGSNISIRATGGAIIIGSDCLLAQNVALVASNHVLRPHALYRKLPWDMERTGVTIGNNAWVGAGILLLPGSSLGHNSVLAVGSVLTKAIPPDQLWAGVPACFLRTLSQRDAD